MKKRLFAAFMASLTILSCVGCGRNGGGTTETATEATTEALTVDYQTLGITPEKFVDKFNKSGSFTVSFSSDYTTVDIGEGKSSFEITNVVGGMRYKGELENETKEIISIECIYEPESGTDKDVARMVGTSLCAFPIKCIFDVSDDEAMNKAVAWSTLSDTTEYKGATVRLGEKSDGTIRLIITKEQ